MMNHYWDGNGYGNDWGWLFMLIWFALIVAAVVIFVRYLGRGGLYAGKTESATDILKKRYAKGEIDKKEYQEKLKDLKG